MPLVRMRDRRTITLTNFTFAEGEVTLVHPCDIPFQSHNRLLYTDEGLEEYFEFSFAEGVTAEQDFLFLIDITRSEALELGSKLRQYLTDAPAEEAAPGGDIAPPELSEAEEAVMAEFSRLLGLQPDAVDPFEEDTDDEEGDDGRSPV